MLFRYIFREIVPSALLGTLLSTFVIFLQKSGPVFELLIRSSARPKVVAYLFTLVFPPLLPMTIPFGVLVGILIALGRMSSDGEITAMRAAGVPSQKVIAPVMTFALLATAAAGACSIWLTPAATREGVRVANKLIAEQLTAEIQPRVFAEQFPNKILYVENVKTGPVVQWQNLFIADLTPPEQRQSGMREKADGPQITVASDAIAVPDAKNNRIQLTLQSGVTHEVDKEGKGYDTEYQHGDQILPANPPDEQSAKDFTAIPTRELPWHARHSPKWLEARIELHKRLAFPIGCIALALVGIPLGVSSRKAGKSGGYVTAVFLAFFCYWLSWNGPATAICWEPSELGSPQPGSGLARSWLRQPKTRTAAASLCCRSWS